MRKKKKNEKEEVGGEERSGSINTVPHPHSPRISPFPTKTPPPLEPSLSLAPQPRKTSPWGPVRVGEWAGGLQTLFIPRTWKHFVVPPWD